MSNPVRDGRSWPELGTRWEDRQGYTLVEVLIAVFILTIALFAVAGLSVVVIRGNATAERITMVTTFAQQKLEQVKKADYAAAANSPHWTHDGSFSWKTLVEDDRPATGMRTVTVQAVRSDSPKAVVELKTVIAQ